MQLRQRRLPSERVQHAAGVGWRRAGIGRGVDGPMFVDLSHDFSQHRADVHAAGLLHSVGRHPVWVYRECKRRFGVGLLTSAKGPALPARRAPRRQRVRR
jgi:hypothetical protein